MGEERDIPWNICNTLIKWVSAINFSFMRILVGKWDCRSLKRGNSNSYTEPAWIPRCFLCRWGSREDFLFPGCFWASSGREVWWSDGHFPHWQRIRLHLRPCSRRQHPPTQSLSLWSKPETYSIVGAEWFSSENEQRTFLFVKMGKICSNATLLSTK